jgi:hypothetical protein
VGEVAEATGPFDADERWLFSNLGEEDRASNHRFAPEFGISVIRITAQ